MPKHNSLYSVLILLDSGKGWLLQKRSNKDNVHNPNTLGLWGGLVDIRDESSPRQTALRELKEETGLGPEDVELIKMDVQEATVFHKGEDITIDVHYFYAEIIKDVAIHGFEGDGVELLEYNANLDEIDHLSPFVKEAIYIHQRILYA